MVIESSILFCENDRDEYSKNPKVAEPVIKNAYLDDICDSVQNVGEAKAMTLSIYKVLKKGGFQVENWISNANLAHDSYSDRVVLGSGAETERGSGTVWLPEDDMK